MELIGLHGGDIQLEMIELIAAFAEISRRSPPGLTGDQRAELIDMIRTVGPPSLGGKAGNRSIGGPVHGSAAVVDQIYASALVAKAVAELVVPVRAERQYAAIPDRWVRPIGSAVHVLAAQLANLPSQVGSGSAARGRHQSLKQLGGAERLRAAVAIGAELAGALGDEDLARRFGRFPRRGSIRSVYPDTPRFSFAELLDEVSTWLSGDGGLRAGDESIVITARSRVNPRRGLRFVVDIRSDERKREFRQLTIASMTLVAMTAVVSLVESLKPPSAFQPIHEFLRRKNDAVLGVAGVVIGVLASIVVAIAIASRSRSRDDAVLRSLTRWASTIGHGIVLGLAGLLTMTGIGWLTWASGHLDQRIGGLAMVAIFVGLHLLAVSIAVLISQFGNDLPEDLLRRQRLVRIQAVERDLSRRRAKRTPLLTMISLPAVAAMPALVVLCLAGLVAALAGDPVGEALRGPGVRVAGLGLVFAALMLVIVRVGCSSYLKDGRRTSEIFFGVLVSLIPVLFAGQALAGLGEAGTDPRAVVLLGALAALHLVYAVWIFWRPPTALWVIALRAAQREAQRPG